MFVAKLCLSAIGMDPFIKSQACAQLAVMNDANSLCFMVAGTAESSMMQTAFASW